jgi:hypothetical protein
MRASLAAIAAGLAKPPPRRAAETKK